MVINRGLPVLQKKKKMAVLHHGLLQSDVALILGNGFLARSDISFQDNMIGAGWQEP